MCGIVCIINLENEEKHQAKDIRAMAERIKHRGPNDEGYFFLHKDECCIYGGDDTPELGRDMAGQISYYPAEHIENFYTGTSSVAFGHRRLSIFDLSPKGHQPMSYLNRYWIIFNGEIFNYLELKNELSEAGYSFLSSSDTEMIMAAYDFWGNNCLNRFNGFWSFVIFDSINQSFFISRDRFGIKPLYYYSDNTQVIFSSEIKAILEHPSVVTAPNLKYIKGYLNSGPKEYIKETAFANIFHFNSASFLETDVQKLKNEGVREQSFWTLAPNLRDEFFDEFKAKKYADQYYDLLKDAVRLRLRADVRIGTALSGGLDSSSIVYLVNQQLKQDTASGKQETFSSVYKSLGANGCDESEYINKMVNFLDVRTNQTEPTAQEVAKEYENVIFSLENIPQSTHMSGWFVYKLVGRSDITITLDGQGADEQLAGYLGYLRNYFIYLPFSTIWTEFKACRKIEGVKMPNIVIGILFNIIRRILSKRVFEYILKFFLERGYYIHLNESLKESTTNGILTNLLHYSDSLSMANSIESRLPFMDYRLVEFLASVPACYKIHGGWTKYIARLAMTDKIPNDVVWRKDKMGWPQPENFWFKGDLKKWFSNSIEASPFLKELGIDSKKLESSFKKGHVTKMIKLLNISIWHKVFFEKNPN